MRNIRIGLACLAAAVATTPAQAASEPFVGEIIQVSFDFCPQGFLPTSGQLLPVSQHAALFSLLGTRYGGDGKENFALPTLVALQGTRYCISLYGAYPSRG